MKNLKKKKKKFTANFYITKYQFQDKITKKSFFPIFHLSAVASSKSNNFEYKIQLRYIDMRMIRLYKVKMKATVRHVCKKLFFQGIKSHSSWNAKLKIVKKYTDPQITTPYNLLKFEENRSWQNRVSAKHVFTRLGSIICHIKELVFKNAFQFTGK